MNHKPQPIKITPGKYLHAKTGNYYEVIGIALHSETLEELVVYRPLYSTDSEMFVRPLSMFSEKVVINGVLQLRFQEVNE